VPRGEVFWDYDSPQIRKNRSRLGLLDSSPANTPLKVSTPKVDLAAEKKGKSVVLTPESLSKGAEEAFQDLLMFSRKVQNKENYKSCDNSKTHVKTEHSNLLSIKAEAQCALDVNMSDDESFLIQCSQALDILENENASPRTNVAAKTVEVEKSFVRSDSFDDILSQLDSDQLQPPTLELRPVVTAREKSHELAEELADCIAQSPVSCRGIKRFKSSDAGIPSSAAGSHAGSIRRVHSSPTIPAEPAVKCSASEIARKREEARKKRELSQMGKKTG